MKLLSLCLSLLGGCDFGYVAPCVVNDRTLPIETTVPARVEGRSDGSAVVLASPGRIIVLDSRGEITSDVPHSVEVNNLLIDQLETASEGKYVTVSVQPGPSSTDESHATVEIDGAFERELPFGARVKLAGLRPITFGVALLWADDALGTVFRSLIRFDSDIIDTRAVATYDRAWVQDASARFLSAIDETALVIRTDTSLVLERVSDGAITGIPEPANAIGWNVGEIVLASSSDARIAVGRTLFGTPFTPPFPYLARNLNIRLITPAPHGIGLIGVDASGVYALIFDSANQKVGGDLSLGEFSSFAGGALMPTTDGYRWIHSTATSVVVSDIVCRDLRQ